MASLWSWLYKCCAHLVTITKLTARRTAGVSYDVCIIEPNYSRININHPCNCSMFPHSSRNWMDSEMALGLLDTIYVKTKDFIKKYKMNHLKITLNLLLIWCTNCQSPVQLFCNIVAFYRKVVHHVEINRTVHDFSEFSFRMSLVKEQTLLQRTWWYTVDSRN